MKAKAKKTTKKVAKKAKKTASKTAVKKTSKKSAQKAAKKAPKKTVAKVIKKAASKTAAKTVVKRKVAKPSRKVTAKAKSKPKAVPKKGVVKSAKTSGARKPVVIRVAAPIAKPSYPPLVDAVLKKLDDAKAEQISVIDLVNRSTMADTMVIASGRSDRHVNAIADQVVEALEKHGIKNIRVEGKPQCDWVLVDSGDIIVHVFRPEVRSFYNLEKLWSVNAPKDQHA